MMRQLHVCTRHAAIQEHPERTKMRLATKDSDIARLILREKSNALVKSTAKKQTKIAVFQEVLFKFSNLMIALEMIQATERRLICEQNSDAKVGG